MATKMRPSSLSSTVVRKLIPRNDYASVKVFTVLDQLGSLHDSLAVLHATPDPSLTRAGRAARYAGQYAKAMAASKAAALAAVDALNDRERELVRDAEIKAGLHGHLDTATATEIRAALRSLPQEQRDQVIREAAQNGDHKIIQAVRTAASPLLTGSITVPMEDIVRMMVTKAAPELADQLADISTLFDKVSGAVDSFAKETATMRDPVGEELASQQAEATRLAEKTLDDAVAGNVKPAEPTTLPTELAH